MTEPLPAGSCIGILGGGQLGRMISVDAARIGYRCHIFEPCAAPAGHVAEAVTTADYSENAALKTFAEGVDVITYEFENVPTEALDILEAKRAIRPNRRALEEIGAPSILKTRRFGYDGKGQVRITDLNEASLALAEIQNAPAVLEGFVEFSHEVSVIAARGLDGAVACYDPGENVHKDGILHTTTVPARLTSAQRTDAVLLAGKILNALDYVGVMGVELFVTPRGLLVNEFAPRVHNSGHWTQNGCAVDQFEQHIRAITGWPLGPGTRHSDVRMLNLIGDDIDMAPTLAQHPQTAVHLYGKAEARPGRKMGHVNEVLGPKS